jgi:Spy/CpxP family protein refolding chaperone
MQLRLSAKALTLVISLTMSLPVAAQQHQAATNTPYAGQQDRDIAALSADDIEDISAGRGWGLALPAELNGVPGPTHLLELSEDLALSDDQINALADLRDTMRSQAINLGEALIEAERALNDAFTSSVPDEQELERLVRAAGQARAALRLAHLKAHLVTPQIVSTEQIGNYNRLRGYTDDPCLSVPEGHNAVMWRRHNGC